MADASSIRKTTSPLVPSGTNPGPNPGSLPGTAGTTGATADYGASAGFYESAIRFQLNAPAYNYTYTNSSGQTATRNTGQAFINSGAQWVPVGNVVLNVGLPVIADDVTQPIFIADRPYNVISVTETHGTASASGTLQVVTAASGTALASGTAVLASTISTAGTANTPVSGTLSATTANTQLAAGSTLGIVVGGTATGYAAGLITVVLQPQ